MTPPKEKCCPECECPESCYFEGPNHVRCGVGYYHAHEECPKGKEFSGATFEQRHEHKAVEGWEEGAARIAIGALTRSKHYAEFSEYIYQEIRSLILKAKEETHEAHKFDQSLVFEKGARAERKRILAALPILEVKRDVVKGHFSLKYTVGENSAETILLPDSIHSIAAIDVSLKVVAAANESFRTAVEQSEERESGT